MSYIVVIPHLTFHDVRTALIKTIHKDLIDDVVVVYEKAILNSDDYVKLRSVAVEKLSKYSGRDFALVLTGSYAACIIVYDVIKSLGGKVVLLQYSPGKRKYEIIEA